MHPAQIKAALTIAGFKQTAVAEACGVKPTTVGAVIHGRSRSKAVEEWISSTTGVALADLWPQWYGEGGFVLTDEERELVTAYRRLPPAMRLRFLTEVLSGQPAASGHSASQGGIVSTGHNARIAGRNFVSPAGDKPKKS